MRLRALLAMALLLLALLPAAAEGGPRVTLHLENADLVYVIKILAKKMGKNVFVAPDVSGTVTVHWDDVPVEQALREVLAMAGPDYGYKIVDNTIVVAVPEKLDTLDANILGCTQVRSPACSTPAPRGGMAAYRRPSQPFNTEGYKPIRENAFQDPREEPLSSFAIDVDTASYANVRRFLNEGSMPPPDAVRVEELVNYFTYEDPAPGKERPFSVRAEVGPCPWNEGHRLLRIGVKGRPLEAGPLPPRNLVFLLDVSGSMDDPAKLPLVKSSIDGLVEHLTARDRVAIVVYAGSSGLVLPTTPGDQKDRIREALGRLEAGGSTNGGEGIQLAYAVAREQFVKGGINRVILATDGDFNVGVTSEGDLVRLIEEEKKSGVFLTVLGFGTGNLKDSQMESLADRGNGNYAYVDSLAEARKVLVKEAGATLVALARDVKIQVEFNPLAVGRYRLVGYENRLLEAQDFEDDAKDGGEIGAGHSVTALYELEPPARSSERPLRYQGPRNPSEAAASGEVGLVKIRYQEPDGSGPSRLLEFPVRDDGRGLARTSADLRFSAAVASWGMLLRNSENRGSASYEAVLDLARQARGPDPEGYRAEFVRLVEVSRALARGETGKR